MGQIALLSFLAFAVLYLYYSILSISWCIWQYPTWSQVFSAKVTLRNFDWKWSPHLPPPGRHERHQLPAARPPQIWSGRSNGYAMGWFGLPWKIRFIGVSWVSLGLMRVLMVSEVNFPIKCDSRGRLHQGQTHGACGLRWCLAYQCEKDKPRPQAQ